MSDGYYQFGRFGTICTRSNYRAISFGISLSKYCFGSTGIEVSLDFLFYHMSYSVALFAYGQGVKVN